MKAKVLGNRGSRELTGVIKSVDVYNDILLGKTDWDDKDKVRIAAYTIPAAVFTRLLDMDRAQLQSDVQSVNTAELIADALDDLAAMIHADESDFVQDAIDDVKAKYIAKVTQQ